MLSDHFDGVGAKYLTEVEVNRLRSNQHEFQGVSSFRSFLGTPSEKTTYDATFHWLDEDPEHNCSVDAFCTWSDVRRANPDRSSEYHLYYAALAEPVVYNARAGDLLVVAKTRGQRLVVVLTPPDSTFASQLLWLFGLDLLAGRPESKELGPSDAQSMGFAARHILDVLDINVTEPEPDEFDKLIETFGMTLPSTAEFSAFARDTCADVDPLSEPDETLVRWMDHEEVLFRHLERRLVEERLRAGFMTSEGADVDGFISFSLGVQNRRKSRAGWAFGHHIEAVLAAHGLPYKREATTEKRNGPDFLFPDERSYHDPNFPAAGLLMLAAKTSCKDRWRQVLAEANRISPKHLITLQPGISEAQTAEMRAESLQLIVPSPIKTSFTTAQQSWLLGFGDFLALVRDRCC
jgi:hypothetical protein